jgi:hypothetical protein
MQGSLEIARCDGGRPGRCVRQMAAQQPIEWQDDSDAFALLGDTSWRDYTVSSDVYLEQPGTVELLGRAGEQQRPQSHQAGYFLRVGDTGRWSIVKSDTSGQLTTLAGGTTRVLGTHHWHSLGLSFSGTTITAIVDGKRIGAVDDSSYSAGQAGLGVVGYRTDEFDNLRITAVRGPAVPPATLTAALPQTVNRGESATMKVTLAVPASGGAVSGLAIEPGAPAGWTVRPTTPTVFRTAAPGHSVAAAWTITAPTDLNTPVTASFAPLATYVLRTGRRAALDARHGEYDRTDSATHRQPLPERSDVRLQLQRLGPVERDTSNGEEAAGDGRTITIRAAQYAKGLGVHANSDVAFYLDGNCSRFTATVGVDDEVAPYGSVIFSVVADGKTLTTTPLLTGTSAALPLDVDVTGARQLDLVVNDSADGNAHDHSDWAGARLTCATG